MTVGAKCNITSFALKEVAKIKWGYNSENNTLPLIDNYIEYLNCDKVGTPTCYDKICIDNTFIFTCYFNVLKISFSIPSTPIDYNIMFFVGNTDFINGVEPYKYIWSFDNSLFDIVGINTLPTLKLKTKGNNKLSLLVTKIHLSVEDKNRCIDIKECYLTPSGMQCGTAYKVCTNTQNLTINSVATPCIATLNLQVT